MKRICIVTHIFPARSETFVKEHVVGLARRGHQVTVVAREVGEDISGAELDEIERLGVERVYLPAFKSSSTKVLRIINKLSAAISILRKPSLYRVFRDSVPWTTGAMLIACSVAKHISRNRFDAVHLHFGTLGARLHRVASHYPNIPPLVVTWHGYDANTIPSTFGHDVYQSLFDSDAQHTVGSTFMKRRLLELGASEERISLIPMGIDLKRFTYRQRELTDGEPLRIISVGRLDEMKGHRYLIEAVQRVMAQGHQISLRIIGEGPLKCSLEEQIATARLGESVVLLGARPSDDVIEELHGAHLFALTGVRARSGRVETQGVVFAEAQATGLPVIACDVGGTADSLVDGVTGRLCASEDVASITEAIASFATDRAQYSRFGSNGREFVEQNFSVEAMLERFDKLYSSSLAPMSSWKGV